MADFRFKQFSVSQEHCAMKLGTDSVLLGAWADVAQACSVLDIGTGTGVLALMVAQRNPTARIHAVELDAAAARQAQANFERSPWRERLSLSATSIQTYSARPDAPSFEALICNPPYYPPAQHSSIERATRAQARQTTTLDFEALLDCAQRLLRPEGRWSLILPCREAAMLLALAEPMWHVGRRVRVLPRTGQPANRELLELRLSSTPTCETGILALRQGPTTVPHHEQYTEAFRVLHRDFLLFL